jgi:hypothetical protein
MSDNTSKFIRLTRDRSHDNLRAIMSLHFQGLYGQETAILRQELDSLIRVCYLLTITDPNERLRLIDDTLNGVKWVINGKSLTDRKMVNIAQQYNHWAPEVYDFGNSFTHLTNYHDFKTTDPLLQLDASRKTAIRRYLNTYHFFSDGDAVTFNNVVPFIPRVAQKVSDNLNRYLDDLENRGAH